jgi:hypothetical protein
MSRAVTENRRISEETAIASGKKTAEKGGFFVNRLYPLERCGIPDPHPSVPSTADAGADGGAPMARP